MTSAAISFVQTASYPVRSGNLVRPLIDGEPAFRRICEAIEASKQSVWATVTFMWATFEMPDGRGCTFDILDRAAARGIDVRLIFWRPDPDTGWLRRNAFWGSTANIDLLNARRPDVKIRWDRAHPGFCQHQKSWLIDAGSENETAFVGGINLNPHSMVAPGHRGEGHNHDAYIELAGPSVADVHHNFVQRWNEASERAMAYGRWGTHSETDLPFPDRIPVERGSAVVQVQRTIHPERYLNGQATPGGIAYDIASGERSNFDQYCAAMDTAHSSIYIENQHIDVPEIVERLHRALLRGVEVVLVMPAGQHSGLRGLGTFDNFLLAGIAGLGADGQRKHVHIHAKLMLIDDEWATAGSCNLHRFSLFGNSELNVAFFEPNTVHAFRSELLQEHLGQDTSGLDDREALRLFRKIARENRSKLEAGDPAWLGLAYAASPSIYTS